MLNVYSYTKKISFCENEIVAAVHFLQIKLSSK